MIFFVAASVGLLMTVIFAFRFQFASRSVWHTGYFVFFTSLMIGLDYFILPEGVLGIEIGLACLFLALLFVVAFRIARRVEQMENKAGSHGPSVGPE